jgi:DNA-binding transcriptional regulator YdaS (Cro superfamily)
MEGAQGTQLAAAVGINEEQVAQSAPLVRALVVQRLEMIWRACEPRINLSEEDQQAGRSVDPRFVEAGIRVTDRLVALYGLTKPQHAMAEPDAGSRVDQRELVRKLVSELEAKVRGQGS